MIRIGICLGLLCTTIAHAQVPDKDAAFTAEMIRKAEDEYKKFFKRPSSVLEYWAVVKYERQVGQFEICAVVLNDLLEYRAKNKETFDKEIVKIEAAEGMFEFLKLQTIDPWTADPVKNNIYRENASFFVDHVYAAVKGHLADPERFKKFIPRLAAETVEEREFAFAKIYTSRAAAVPHLVQALRENVEKPLFGKIVERMVRLTDDIVPPLLETLRAVEEDPSAKDLPPNERAKKNRQLRLQDASEVSLRLTILEILRKRELASQSPDRRSVPYLIHLSSSPIYPELLRERAKELLGLILGVKTEYLPPAKVTLTEMAEKLYQHKVRFPTSAGVPFWKWDGKQLDYEPTIMTPSQAEEFFGLRYARDALELDPSYIPAQLAYLSLMLQRRLGPTLDKFVLQPMPDGIHSLLARLDVELLLKLLERGLDEGNFAAVLAATQILGDRGDIRALRQGAGNRPSGLVRALYYPDRRVQAVAVKAMLNMPGKPVPAIAARVVEVLNHSLTLDESSRALMIGFPTDQIAAFRADLEAATGFKLVSTSTVAKAFQAMEGFANFEVIFLHQNLGATEMPYVISQLRQSSDAGRLPIFLLVAKDKQSEWEKRVARFPGVRVLPDVWAKMADELKNVVQDAMKQAGLKELSADERKAITRSAVDTLWRMARQEIAGYNLIPNSEKDTTVDNVFRLIKKGEFATEGMEILGRLPGFMVQQELVRLTVDPGLDKQRITAARELNRHVQKHGLLVGKNQVEQLREALLNPKSDVNLKRELSLLAGSQRITSSQSGTRLFQFAPPAPMPIPPKPLPPAVP